MSAVSSCAQRRLIIGVGNAGVTVLDLLALEHPSAKGLLIVNNDGESLSASVVTDRVTVPEGDPKEGFLAIDRKFEEVIAGASIVVLCGGLGGESGSFLLPALAILAKSMGITVAACVGMPFSFEGRGKRELAAEALEKLYGVCDAVAVIENDRLSGGSPSTAAVGEAFALSDRTLLGSLRAVHGMLSTSGPVKITRSDLKGLLGIPGAVTLFGTGTAEGSNRLHEALEKAFKSPLLNLPGKSTPASALAGVSSVLLLLNGPPDLSFAEVQIAVGEIERITGERCQIKTGVHADLPAGSPITLSIISSSGGTTSPEKPVSTRLPEVDVAPKKVPAREVTPAKGGTDEFPKIGTAPARPTAGTAVAATAKKTNHTTPTNKQTQGTLDLEPAQKGRFEKSEPTIVAGEDLDIPTFMRKGIKLTPPHRN